MPSSKGSSQPRNQTHVSYVSYIGRWVFFCFVLFCFFTSSATLEAPCCYHSVIIALTVLSPDLSGNPRGCVTGGSDALLGAGRRVAQGSAFCLALAGQGLLRLLGCEKSTAAKPAS